MLLETISLFVWPWLLVNDRKFSAGTIFISHINKPTVFLHELATIQTRQPNRFDDVVKDPNRIYTVVNVSAMFVSTAYQPQYFSAPVNRHFINHTNHAIMFVS